MDKKPLGRILTGYFDLVSEKHTLC